MTPYANRLLDKMRYTYVIIIFLHLVTVQVEQSRRPRDDYIGVVVDWLMDVVDEFKLLADTLYLLIHILANSSQWDKLSFLVSLHYLLLCMA